MYLSIGTCRVLPIGSMLCLYIGTIYAYMIVMSDIIRSVPRRNIARQKATPLTMAVLESGYYGLDRERLIDQIIREILSRYSRSRIQDDLVDFLLSFRTRITRMLVRYEFYGVPFEHYLMRVVRFSFLKYRQSKQKRHRYVDSYISLTSKSMSFAQPSANTSIAPTLLRIIGLPGAQDMDAPLSIAQQKRVLIFSLKISYWLGDTQLQEIATLVGYEYQLLRLITETIRLRLAEQFSKHRTYTESRDHVYARLMQRYCDLPQSAIELGDVLYERPQYSSPQQLSNLQRKLDSYNERINRCRIVPTNDLISVVLNIPKGTVDTAMATMKRRYTRLYSGA